MEVMFERVAGLDVAKASVAVCVRTPGARRGTRRGSLAAANEVLRAVQVTAPCG